MAEGVGFEPTVELPLLLISSQMPLTTQPPFRWNARVRRIYGKAELSGKLNQAPTLNVTGRRRGDSPVLG